MMIPPFNTPRSDFCAVNYYQFSHVIKQNPWRATLGFRSVNFPGTDRKLQMIPNGNPNPNPKISHSSLSMFKLQYQSTPHQCLNHFLLPISSLRSPSHSFKNRIPNAINSLNLSNLHAFCFDSCQLRWNRRRSSWRLCVRASKNSFDSSSDGVRASRGLIDAIQPSILVVRSNIGSKFAIGFYIAFAIFAIVVREIMLKKNGRNHHGSVADLVKRGQLRSDRRGISKPLKYEDPFNNPLVKVGKSDSSIEMCGNVYRLAPVTLTEEQQSMHQKRRSRAYQWKRPTIFLKEGDSIPPDVDPDVVKWIPVNHPFATTVSDIDEDMAQTNVSQKHGVPSRVKAEHETLRKKLEDLQNEQRFSEVAINPKGVRDSVQSSSTPHEHLESSPPANQQYSRITSKPNLEGDSCENQISPDESKREL